MYIYIYIFIFIYPIVLHVCFRVYGTRCLIGSAPTAALISMHTKVNMYYFAASNKRNIGLST